MKMHARTESVNEWKRGRERYPHVVFVHVVTFGGVPLHYRKGTEIGILCHNYSNKGNMGHSNAHL